MRNNKRKPNSLDEMSLEELWELFPIFLVDPDAKWEQQYGEMEAMLNDTFKELSGLRISHIGSTAINGIKAKDIVDVLVEVGASESLPAMAEALELRGFTVMSESPSRISLNLGYTPDGFAEEVFHVHLRHRGDNDELYFRDYLIDHPSVAQDYEMLKLRLCSSYEYDRDAYTEGKGSFIRKWTEEGRSAYHGRY